ncbi:MAG: FGGY family carbohydrate kinase [Nocardioidaceae bacterium]
MERLTQRYGDQAIRDRCGSSLSTQAAGAKIAWVADEEPELFAKARRLFMPSSWLVHELTGEYVLDHQSASQSTPLYDIDERAWFAPWVARHLPRDRAAAAALVRARSPARCTKRRRAALAFRRGHRW